MVKAPIRSLRGIKVLIVEDDKDVLEVTSAVLSEHGARVTGAADGHEFQGKLQGGPYDLVIVDLKLPDTDGLACIRQARRQHPSAAVLLMTAYGTSAVYEDAIRLGASGMIKKPFTVERLLAVVQDALSRS